MPTLTRAASSVGGGVLAAATGGLATIRRAAKPLHPFGEVVEARVFRNGCEETAERTGVDWLDEPGADDAVVRLSQAIGLAGWLPDIHGLAMRVRTADAEGDVLFATTGRGRLSRFVLLPTRRPQAPLSTLLPYQTPTGPVVLGAEPLGPDTFELSWARPSGDWQPFGCLRLASPVGDPEISFDPLQNRIPGLEQYPAVQRLREPAYARARHSREED